MPSWVGGSSRCWRSSAVCGNGLDIVALAERPAVETAGYTYQVRPAPDCPGARLYRFSRMVLGQDSRPQGRLRNCSPRIYSPGAHGARQPLHYTSSSKDYPPQPKRVIFARAY